jgi:hypothetical protein
MLAFVEYRSALDGEIARDSGADPGANMSGFFYSKVRDGEGSGTKWLYAGVVD